MSPRKNTRIVQLWRAIVRALPRAILLVAFAFVLSVTMQAPLAFSAAFLSSSRPNDFEFGDFYNVVADARPVADLDNRIVIVNLDGSDRTDITSILEVLQMAEPAAIGLDVMFDSPRDSLVDQWLTALIDATPRLVLAQSLTRNDTTGLFSVAERSFFIDSLKNEAHFGAINLPSRYQDGMVRDFVTLYEGENGEQIRSFPVAVAEMADPEELNGMKFRGNHLEPINYPSREFTILTLAQLADDPAQVDDKIVLIGAVNEFEDMHPTPIHQQMSGIMIHAYALSTLVHENWIDKMSPAGSWAIACLFCFIITLLFCIVPTGVKGLVLRTVQVILLAGVVYFGYVLYVEHHILIDFSYSLLMVTFGLFACDLQLGLTTIGKGIWKRVRTIKIANKKSNIYGTQN